MPAVPAFARSSYCASYGRVHSVGIVHSVNFSVLVSNIARRLPLNTPHQIRPCESMCPRRQPAPLVGKSYHVVCSVLASVFQILSLVICMPHALFCESAITSYARADGLPCGYLIGVHSFFARSTRQVPPDSPVSNATLNQSLPSTSMCAGSIMVKCASPHAASGVGSWNVSILPVFGSSRTICSCDMFP